MVFKARDAHTFKVKVAIPTRNDGKPRTFSAGTRDRGVANDVERMVHRMKERRQWTGLEAVFDNLVTLAEVYDADVSGALEELMTRLRDVDLDSLVTTWAERANAKYVKQVRRLIVEGERFPASSFRRKRIAEFLAGLEVDNPTRNRYRAALSVFAKWLVEREVLETNPVRDVAQYPENDPRMTWMTLADAKRVAAAADEPVRGLIALLAGSGMELGPALVLTAANVTKDKKLGYIIHADGTKTNWRNRVVKLEDWAAPFLASLLRTAIGGGLLFPGLRPETALIAFKEAQSRVGISGHRLHDLRHTYAVNALKKGYKAQVVAHQLGHKDASMVIKVYGRFVPDASDYAVTNSATSARVPREVKHGS